MKVFLTSLSLIILLSTFVNAKIVFNSFTKGNTGLFVMDDDGSDVTLLIDKSVPKNARWSPDGRQIVFQQYNFDIKIGPTGNYISIMNADGTNIRQLTKTDLGPAMYPSFTPDGKQILFSGSQLNKHLRINILDLDSGEIQELGHIKASSANMSPDDKQIVYSTHPFGNEPGNLWIMDMDGSNVRQLLPPPEDGQRIIRQMPRWSPDGKQILYAQSEYVVQQVGKIEVEIHKAHRYMICDTKGENIDELNIPKNWKPLSVGWMDNGDSVVLSMREIELDKLNFVEKLDYYIYKYHLGTEKLTALPNPLIEGFNVDWISGNALSVTSKDKMQTQWGEIKKASLGQMKNRNINTQVQVH